MAISGIAELTGRVLAGRYRLLAPIGAGASGRVYVADDVRLRRRVAVKVLHPALADDAGFLRRFRVEAQVAASLNHANVMAVFDWGEDDGVPFMVTELLSGGSLRSVLDSGARLSPAQAVHLGGQVAAALEYAHVRGLVHRDIKPANLLFDEHGIVRVADFGLARALAEASWTEPVGAVVGTARYAAPEQATGSALDGRADLYALAVVLVEAVTGSVPDVAETLIGTLALRSRQSLSAPLELGRLGPVVERAGRIEPADRYPDAATMRAALVDAARSLPPPGPIPLVGLGAMPAPSGEPTQLGRRSPLFDQDATHVPATKPVPTVAPVRRRPNPVVRAARRRLVPAVVSIAIVLALVGAAGALVSARTGVADVAVPQLTGLARDDALTTIAKRGLVVSVVEQQSDDPAGRVVEQRPAAGRFVGDGSRVRLVISTGPPPVPVPDVAASRTAAEATQALEAAGFVVETITATDETVASGRPIRTDPAAGQNVARDSTVKLVVSAGPAPVAVPDVSKGTYDEAVAKLTAQKLKATMREDFSATVDKGKVIGTDPAAGASVARDSTVTVIVSKGPEMVSVPTGLKGLSLDAARQRLEAAGLGVDTTGYLPGRTVRAYDPEGGEKVAKGTVVTLFF